MCQRRNTYSHLHKQGLSSKMTLVPSCFHRVWWQSCNALQTVVRVWAFENSAISISINIVSFVPHMRCVVSLGQGVTPSTNPGCHT